MKYLNNWNQINESEESQKETPKRSERLLTQAQKEHQDSPEEKSGPTPSIVFTDVVGSSEMWSDDPMTMFKQLENHHKLVEVIAEKNKGWIVKTIGDAFMVYFEPSEYSLYNAINFSKDLIISEKSYKLRVGVCQGHMEQKTYRIQKVDLKDFFGNTVNSASRMESKVAESDGIAFCSLKTISGMDKIKSLGKVVEVDLSKHDLRGASVKKAYKIKIK